MNKEKFIYLLESTDLYHEPVYKIGLTKNNIQKRIKQLQTGNHENIRMISFFKSIYANNIEKALHYQYSDKKVLGEWFKGIDKNNFIIDCINIEENIRYLNENKI